MAWTTYIATKTPICECGCYGEAGPRGVGGSMLTVGSARVGSPPPRYMHHCVAMQLGAMQLLVEVVAQVWACGHSCCA